MALGSRSCEDEFIHQRILDIGTEQASKLSRFNALASSASTRCLDEDQFNQKYIDENGDVVVCWRKNLTRTYDNCLLPWPNSHLWSYLKQHKFFCINYNQGPFCLQIFCYSTLLRLTTMSAIVHWTAIQHCLSELSPALLKRVQRGTPTFPFQAVHAPEASHSFILASFNSSLS